MDADASKRRDQETAHLIALTVCCPFDQSNPPECQLHDLRCKPMRERLDAIKRLTSAERAAIVETHKGCLARKEMGFKCNGSCGAPLPVKLA
jgi:hypothetical protein